MAPILDVLRQVPYFANLDPDLLKDLAGQVRERKYQAGEVILLEGEPCEGLYFVIGGRVKVFKVSGEGKEQVLRILGPGRTFNDVPVFDGGPNPGSVSAMEPTTVSLVPKAQILAMVERHPQVAKAVIRLLASRLRALTLVIEDLSLRSVVSGVAKLLLDCTRGHQTLVEGGAGACARLTQHQLVHSGRLANPPAASKVISQLQVSYALTQAWPHCLRAVLGPLCVEHPHPIRLDAPSCRW